jgi:aminoglycoside phosphotransferase (APT) family kinase protein
VPDDSPSAIERPKTSTRDREVMRQQLQRWLATHHRGGATAQIVEFSAPSTNGMSSETILFTVESREGRERLVARLSPDPDAVPVFPTYDLEKQFRIMQLVRERTTVPVPEMRWYEPDADVLGAPFLVMGHVDGRVPPDMLPYVFGSFLTEASAEQRAALQESTVKLLVDLHATRLDPSLDFLEYPVPGNTPLQRHVADQRNYYDWVASDGVASPLIERSFAWLDAHWPDERESRISWGDSRIGNILYDGFAPAAVLDWEMVGIAPREVDIGWLVFMHHFFQNSAERAGVTGLPDFLRPDDVAAAYERMSGYRPIDLAWYETYAALRFAIIMFRIHRRMVHFGEATVPDDPDAAIHHRDLLDQMMAG